MKMHAVIEVGGKQYLVEENTELLVERLGAEVEAKLEFPILLSFDSETHEIQVGTPALKTLAKAQVMEHIKGDKIRVAKFKSKVRYRKVRGFRPQLSRIKILSI